MKGFTWLALLLVWAIPVFSVPCARADETQKAIPAATEEEEDYPIITDEDYPYLDEDNAAKPQEKATPAPAPTENAPAKPQN